RFDAGQTRVQSHRWAARQLDQGWREKLLTAKYYLWMAPKRTCKQGRAYVASGDRGTTRRGPASWRTRAERGNEQRPGGRGGRLGRAPRSIGRAALMNAS